MQDSSMASTETKMLKYTGERFEILNLEKSIQETRYREEQKESTCTRQIPYTVNECRDETFYNTVCHMTPGRNECRTEYERVCRYETRYRQKCHMEGNGEECHTTPSREECRNIPGKRKCRTNRRGERVCRDTPSRRVCNTRPGRRVCKRRPGRRVCRQESYQDRVCNRVPQRRCQDIPPRQVCEQVPYTKNICRDVTKYRSESYACMKPVTVPYVVTVKVKTNVNVNFNVDSDVLSANTDFVFTLLTNGGINVTAKDNSIAPLFVFMHKNLNQIPDDLELNVEGEINFDLKKKSHYLNPFMGEFEDIVLRKRSLEFSLPLIKDVTGINFALKLERKGEIVFNAGLNQNSFSWNHADNRSYAVVDFETFDFKVKKKKDYKMTLIMNLKPIAGNLLNPVVPLPGTRKEIEIRSKK